jgi:hypothetical protein
MNETQMASTPKAKSNWAIKWALILGITIVLNLFFSYGISLIYKTPTFEGFCPIEVTSQTYTDKVMCTKAGGQWTENTYPAPIDKSGVTNPVQVNGYCNATYTCSQHFDTAQSLYNRNVFIILVILGILSLAFGAFIAARSSVVSLGFSLGGVVALIIGAIRYWSNMQDVLRVVVLAVALAALVWIGIKKIQE